MSVTQAAQADSGAKVTPADFAAIADLVRNRSGISLGPDKAYLVESRLTQVVRAHGLRGLADLASRLRGTPDEKLASEVVDAMTTNETLFFRDSRPFEHLRTAAIPDAHRRLPPGRPLRIWSAASSSGQEAYSIAMAAGMADAPGRAVEILATDISHEQLARARAATYTEFEVRRGLSAEMMAQHFDKAAGGWRAKPRLRSMVEFRHWNLLDDPQRLGAFDVIFCRNVLIYFDVPTKRRVLEALWSRLPPGGWLYLGGAETTFGVSDGFEPCPGTHQVYRTVPR